jgi:hypothetical protein
MRVARLHASANYAPGVAFHMSPPLITRDRCAHRPPEQDRDPGLAGMPLFRLLRRGKALRGTALDPFGYQEERKAERALIEQYIADLREVLATLRPETMETAVSLASLPDMIRGFGPSEGQRTGQSDGPAEGIAIGAEPGARRGDGRGVNRPLRRPSRLIRTTTVMAGLDPAINRRTCHAR